MRVRVVWLAIILCITMFQVRRTQAQAVFGGDYAGFGWEEVRRQGGLVDIEFLPNGRVLVAGRAGTLLQFTREGGFVATTADLRDEVNSGGDSGLMSILVDPDFENSPWVYLFYAVETNPESPDSVDYRYGRIERRLLDAANDYRTFVPDSEEILLGATWDTGILMDGQFHVSGEMAWGTDGTLIISTGDAHQVAPWNQPRNSPSFTEGHFPQEINVNCLRAQMLNNYSGKLLRIDRHTGLGLASNPYYTGDPDDIESRIWAYGLWMPYRISVLYASGEHDPSRGRPGRVIVAEVGDSTYEEVHVTSPSGGDNFGWPFYEGDLNPPPRGIVGIWTYGEDVYDGPVPFVPYEGTTPPIIGIPRDEAFPAIPSDVVGDARAVSITGGFVYDYVSRYLSFDGETTPTQQAPYPPILDGKYLFADWGLEQLYAAEMDSLGNIAVLEVIAEGSLAPDIPYSGPVALEYSPYTGEIYLFGSPFLWRLNYDPTGGPPIVSLTADRTSGPLPLTVTFDASGSVDPADSGPLTFMWDYGDGSDGVETSDGVTSHTYHVDADLLAMVTVVSNSGRASSRTLAVHPGNLPPIATIEHPDGSFTYPLGGPAVTMHFKGTAEDPDGISSPAVRWLLALGHNEHRHDLTHLDNVLEGEFEIEDPQEENTWFILELIVTDERGETVVKSVEIRGEPPPPAGSLWIMR